jgi:micrococcal nuclease
MEPVITSIIAPDDPGAEIIAETLKVEVLKVFDGDGFLADFFNPVRQKWVKRVPCRFAFIDAPEMEQPFGLESMEFLHKLIAGKTLQVCPIVKESTSNSPIDHYKRFLCMAFLSEQMQVGQIEYYLRGGCGTGQVKTARTVTRNIELEMIVNGWAWVVEQYAFEREDEYFDAQEDAWRNRRGLWAMDNPEPPWKFKQKQRRRKEAEAKQPSLFTATNSQCPVQGCSGHLVERKGNRGPFFGCSDFPRCRYSQNS